MSFKVRIWFWVKRKEKYERRIREDEMKSFHVSLSLSLSVSVLLKALRMFVCVYELCNSPPRSYRQPDGNGQLLSRRYCTRSVWLFSCDQNTARESQGALAVSCKYLSTSR